MPQDPATGRTEALGAHGYRPMIATSLVIDPASYA